jgi:TRAP transporter TAXI family solute receptor
MKAVFAVAASAAVLLAAAHAEAQRPQSMTVATASAGGVYAVYGQGVATLISDVVGIPTSTRQTQGPNQNMVLIQNRQAELGMVTAGPALEAWTGRLELNRGVQHTDVRALFPMYPTPFQAIALQQSNIRSLADLAGKRVGAGPRAGTGGDYWPRWLRDMGVEANFQFGPIGDQGSQLADGRLDAIVTAGGIPHPTLSELETSHRVTFIGFSDDDARRIAAADPSAVPFSIPAGTYRQQAGPVQTVAMWNVFVGHKDLPEDVAYAIVKAVFENPDRMVATHAAARDTVLDNIATNTVIPYHPGAVRYFRERGVAVPDAVLPR